MVDMPELLKSKLPELSGDQVQKLCLYYELLLEGNKRMNLTKITSPDEAADKHFVDSLNALEYIPKGAKCIDVGTGAGLPGIPVLITRDDIQMTLLDSLNKRVRFLRETCAALNIDALFVHSRAEDAGRGSHFRERYDIALSRAVAPLNVLLELTIPFVKKGGASICYKGRAAYEEAEQAQNAAKQLGCRLEVIKIDSSYAERYLIIAKKQRPTPAMFPRRAGEPSHKPL